MNDTDEISLVDLFAVVLRYRRLIIGLPLIVTAAVGIYLFALPLFGMKTSNVEYQIQYSASINQLPLDLKDRIGIDTTQSLNAYFSNVSLQVVEYGKYFPKDLAGKKDGELMTFIKKELIEKKLKYSKDSKEPLYTLSFTTQDMENGERYLSTLWSGAVAQLTNRLRESYTSSLALLDQGIKVYDSAKKLDAESLNGKAELVSVQQEIIKLQSDSRFPFETEPEQIVFIENGGGRIKTILIAFFASLSVAVLISCCLQAVRGVKNDPDSMAKIREALADGKMKR
jgi:hypothetical protein